MNTNVYLKKITKASAFPFSLLVAVFFFIMSIILVITIFPQVHNNMYFL